MVGTGAVGGIGRFERLLVAALTNLTERNALRFTSIWRRRHPDYLHISGDPRSGTDVQSVETSIPAFAAQLARAVLRIQPDLVLFLHINLAQAAPLVRALGARRYAVATYGVEVWSPLQASLLRALHGASEVIAISDYTAQQLVHHQRLPRSQIHVVPLALEPHWLEQAAAPTMPRDVRTPPATGPQLLSVSRLEPAARDKGIDHVIRSLSEVRDAVPGTTYRVIGDGSDRPYLERVAEECGVAAAVDFRGSVSHDDLIEEYRRTDVFVLPSQREGFGLVFLEAMAHAKPVIARRAAAAPEVVVDGSTGILVDDGAGLAAAIISLLSDAGRLRDMGKTGAQRVRTVHSFDAFTAKVEAMIQCC